MLKFMKKIPALFLYVCIFVITTQCKSDDIITVLEEVVLTPNVEVYNANLLENSLVLAIENGGTASYLLDKTGTKVYEWSFETNLGNDLELLPDGKLIGMFKSENPIFSFGGFGGVIKILNIDGTTAWEYETASANQLAHHDVELLPNGNVLFLVWEKITAITAQQQGVNTTVDIYPEVLIEVNPNTNQIEWEWHSWNHIIQDVDSNLPNYGVLSDNPQLININYNLAANGDIMHSNGIDFDSDKNVIYMSINGYSEVWVIDHSTTTAEATTAIGGNYNKGGNLLYRFGNPETYNNAFGERIFFNNHFPNLLENNVPGAGHVLIYMNGNNANQSTVFELEIPEPFSLQANMNNEPSIIWSFTDENLFYAKISGTVRLNNGNTLICEGDYGFWEVTSNNEIAWKYNGDGNTTFWRCYNYALDSDEIISLGL